MTKLDNFDYFEMTVSGLMMYFGWERLKRDKRDGMGVVLSITGFTYLIDVTRHIVR